ncbi:Hypothetical predicted protein [Mytilus galloprovincialis]|uniref:Uncharacterized protein n=1 Tax=Mytilus galloprovincialis TaxID=29158 RepID=A0A8B6FE16_MYTGA|nr:Hypothetical predicted protein [Mytilus galloprovincialis]
MKLQLLQLLVQSKNEILHRDVSCACVLSEECSGHVLKVSKVAHDQPVTDTKMAHNTCGRNKTDNSSRKDTLVEIKQPQTDRKEEVDNSRHDKYDEIMLELKACKSYRQLKKKCEQISSICDDLVLNSQPVNIMGYGMEVDSDLSK